MKQKDAYIGGNPRETRVPPRRRQPTNAASMNAKSKRRRFSKTPGRLTITFLIVFGSFGWIQWFLAVTYLPNDHMHIDGGARMMHLDAQSTNSFTAQQEERRPVHQIQLTDSHIHHSITHVVPNRDDFRMDWLGTLVEELEDPCQPRQEWQLPQNTPYTCNLIHEVSFEHFEMIGCGNDRCAVQIQDLQGYTVAFKTMRYIQHYNEEDYRAGWMDIVVTSRLSSSPIVISPFASCGLSLVSEQATNATLMDHILLARQQKDYLNTPEIRLKISHQVALALATLHDGMDSGNVVPSVAHNDFCARNFIYTNDGVYKLFDFDSASFTTFDKNGTVCLERPEHMDDEWDKIKAPEEFHRHARKDLILKYKADVWILGDLLYYILTKKWVFEGISREEAKLQMLAGIGSDIKESDNPLDQTIVTAIQMAWTLDAETRPSASEIASFLRDKLEQVFGKPGGGTVWRVSVPPLPTDYISTFDDFYENLK